HVTFPLDLNYPSAIELVAVTQTSVRGLRNLYKAWDTLRFHAAGGVHCITVHVIDELLDAHNRRYNRAGVDTDPNMQRLTIWRFEGSDLVEHIKSNLGN